MGELDLNNRGGVLIFVLWVIMFLTIMALSLGQRVRVGLAFVDGHSGEVKAKALAWAGVAGAVERVRDSGPGQRDTLYACGLRVPEGQTPQTLFRHVGLGEGTFDVAYTQDGKISDGIQDEERKINLNALNAQEEKVLYSLVQLSGLNADQADVFSDGIFHRLTSGRLESLEEILLIPGVSKDMYEKVKDVLSVYPKAAFVLKVNLNTASRRVIGALARAQLEEHLSVEDADHLTDKMLAFRAGDDGQEGTPDDKPIEFSKIDFNVTEKILAEKIARYRSESSNYLRIRSRGIYKKSTQTLNVVIYRPHLSIVAWRLENP